MDRRIRKFLEWVIGFFPFLIAVSYYDAEIWLFVAAFWWRHFEEAMEYLA